MAPVSKLLAVFSGGGGGNIDTYLGHCSISGICVACVVTDQLKNLPDMVLNEGLDPFGTLKPNPEGRLTFLSLDIKWL